MVTLIRDPAQHFHRNCRLHRLRERGRRPRKGIPHNRETVHFFSSHVHPAVRIHSCPFLCNFGRWDQEWRAPSDLLCLLRFLSCGAPRGQTVVSLENPSVSWAGPLQANAPFWVWWSAAVPVEAELVESSRPLRNPFGFGAESPPLVIATVVSLDWYGRPHPPPSRSAGEVCSISNPEDRGGSRRGDNTDFDDAVSQESPLDRLCAHVIGFCPSRLVVIGREGLFLKSNLRSYWITIFGRSGNDDVVHHFGSDSYRSSRPLLCHGPPPARQQQKGDTAGGDDSKRQQQGARLCCALSRWQTRINMGRSRLCPTKSLRLQPARPSNSR
jgi:hypothetical protein